MAVDWGQFELQVDRPSGRAFRFALSGQIIALLVALALGFPFAAAVAASAGLPNPFGSDPAEAAQPGDVPPDDMGDERGQGGGTGTERGGPAGQGTGRGNDPGSTGTGDSGLPGSTGTTTGNDPETTTTGNDPGSTGTTTTTTTTGFVWPPEPVPTTIPCICLPPSS